MNTCRSSKRIKTESTNITATADGFYQVLNLPDDLMREVALKCPVVPHGGKEGKNRGIRFIVKNDTEYFTSEHLLDKIHKEVMRQLAQHGIKGNLAMSNAEWVLASNSRAKRGQTHRDTRFKRPGYFTVLIFFGDRKNKGYGGLKLWRNSQNFLPDGIFKNADRELKKLDRGGGFQPNLKEFNCVVFDSRLIHVSLPHIQHELWASLTCYLRFEGLISPGGEAESITNPQQWGIKDLSEYI